MTDIPNDDLRPAAALEYPELAPRAPEQYPLAASPEAPAAEQGYPFPPGTPEKVPADFAKAQEDAYADRLTPDEIAEFRALRAEKKARDEAAAKEAAEAAAKLSAPTHTVLLADGSRVDGSTIATHYATEAGELVPVAGAFLKPEFVTLPL
jgi:hypothetical protein